MAKAEQAGKVPNTEPRLRLVDPETGEIVAHECPECQKLRDQLAGAENNVHSMRAQMAALKREVAGEIDREHKLFPEAIALFRYWQERCDHSGVEFKADHMKAVLPRLKEHGPERCRQAIRGAAFDPFVTTMKNGRPKRHDDWFQIFRADKFDSFVERAPDYEPPTFTQLALIEHAQRVAERVLERARLIEGNTDSVACAHLLLEIDRLNREWINTPHRRDAK